MSNKNSSKNVDIFGDSVEENASSFADLFENSLRAKSLKSGDRFTGEVLAIGKTEVFIATGTPTDGAIPTRDLLDKQGQMTVKIGDTIAVQVVRIREGEILLKKADSVGSSQDVDSLEDAFDMELPVEGKVLEIVKGGFRVQVMGQKAFCPISQIDLGRVEDQQKYVGLKLDFIITQFENKGRNIVVSRRKLLEMEQAEQEGAFLQTAKVGDVLEGTVGRLERFGAFVRLEAGPEGLVPISELAWGRIGHPQEIVTPGQKVTVKIMKIEEQDNRLRISLSLKQADGASNPWMHVMEKYPVGSQHEGVVDKKETYGLFVHLAPGISGLLPKSKWRDAIDNGQFENKKKGDKIKIQIEQIQFEEKKLTFTIPSDIEDGSWKQHSQTSGLGTFADLFKNADKSKK